MQRYVERIAVESAPASVGAGRIVGDGEIPALIRERDWSSTALGALTDWSDGLVCSMNLMLACAFPSLLFWGPEMIQFYNEAFRPLIGEKHPEAIGQPARVSWSEAWEVIGPQLKGVLERGATISQQKMLVPILRNGRLEDVWWNYSYSPVFAPNGSTAGILVVCQDVTGELEAVRSLKATEERASRILESIAEGVIVTDPERRITRLNRMAESLTGWRSDEAAGRQLSQVFRILDEGTRVPLEGPAGAAELEENADARKTPAVLLRRNGSEVPVESSAAIIQDAEGRSIGVVLVFHSVAEQRRAARALVESEKIAAVGRLASSIAHEINNPLEAVTNLLYLARQKASMPQVQEYLQAADHELRRVSAIANQTLRFHKQTSNPEAVEAADLFSTVLGIYEGRLRNSGVSVEIRHRTREPVLCFQGDVRQVLNNLVGNAIDAMGRSGGRLLIRSQAAKDWPSGRQGVVFTVADTGSGMTHAVRERIFEPFFTTKGIGGTGLGLWVSQEVVQRHRGVLRVRSSKAPECHGTVFRFFLPYAQEAEPMAQRS